MEEVGHDVAGDAAFFVDEFMAKINPDDVLVVHDFLEDLVHLKDFAPLRIWIFTARENGEQENFRGGKFGAQFLDDGADAVSDLFGGVVFAVGIVRSDHQDGGFGAEAFEIPVIQAPEDMLGAVATDAEVDRVVFGETFRPNFFAVIFPTVRDRIANENELSFFADFFDALVERGLALFPAIVRARNWIDGGMAGGVRVDG